MYFLHLSKIYSNCISSLSTTHYVFWWCHENLYFATDNKDLILLSYLILYPAVDLKYLISAASIFLLSDRFRDQFSLLHQNRDCHHLIKFNYTLIINKLIDRIIIWTKLSYYSSIRHIFVLTADLLTVTYSLPVFISLRYSENITDSLKLLVL